MGLWAKVFVNYPYTLWTKLASKEHEFLKMKLACHLGKGSRIYLMCL